MCVDIFLNLPITSITRPSSGSGGSGGGGLARLVADALAAILVLAYEYVSMLVKMVLVNGSLISYIMEFINV